MRRSKLWLAGALLAAPLATTAIAQQAQPIPAPADPYAAGAPNPAPAPAMPARPAVVPPAQAPLIAADAIIGAKVRDANGEELGQVKQLMLAPDGRVQYAVLAIGAVLGVGGQEVAMPWQQMKIARDGTNVIVTADRQVLTQAPKYDASSDARVDTDDDAKDKD